MSDAKNPLYAVAICNNAGISCCGFREAYQYRSGEVTLNKNSGREIITDEYFGAGYVEQNTFIGKSAISTQDAAKECLTKWLANEHRLLKDRESVYKIKGEYMRTFNFVKTAGRDSFYSQELRDEVMKLDCHKNIMIYVNANTCHIIETHILIINKDTSYA